MANRTITTTLKLNVADFKLQARQAASSLEDLVKKGDKTGQLASTSMGRMAQTLQFQRGAWDTASNAMLGWGAAGVAAVGMVVAKYATFDQAMSNVQASTHESAENMGLLREAAIKAGADTQYSATEAAGAIEELAKAGISTADILGGGLDGALSLAAAGGLEVAEAAGIASVALTQFKLSGQDVGHVADLLAAGAGKAMGDVQDLGMALKQSGLVASQTGLSIEETTGALSAFASAGLLGSDAGTSFKSMLQRLTPQSKEAKNLMEDLGISAYDTQGNFVGLSAFAGNLQESLSGLTVEQRNSAMATIFGSDAVRAAAVIYDQGQEGIQGWIDKVNDSGYAAETAAARMDNLKGDWEGFTGSLETLLLQSGGGVNDGLRGLVQMAEVVVDALGKIPEPILETVTSLGGITAVTAVAMGGVMKLTTSVYDSVTAFQSLSTAGGALGKSLKWGGIAAIATVAIAGVAAAIEHFTGNARKAAELAREYGDTLDEVSGKATQATRELAAKNLVDSGWAQKIKDAGGDIQVGVDALLGNAQAIAEISDLMNGSGIDMTTIQGLQGQNLRSMGSQWDEYAGIHNSAVDQAKEKDRLLAEATEDVAGSQEGAAGSTDQFTSSSLAAADAAQAQASALQDLIDAQEENANSMLGLRGAQREWVTTLSDANETIAANGQNLDLSTEAGRANQAALDDIAQSGLSLVDSMYQARDANGNLVYSQEEVKAAMEDARAKFIEAAIAAGYGADEAAVLADNLGLIPGTYTAKVEVVDGASRVVSEIQTRINSLTGKTVDVVVNYLSNGNIREYTAGYGGGTQVKAEGGAIYGPGTGTSDSIPAMLSNGEHVVTAREVQNLGGQHAMYALRSAIRTQPGTLRAALGFASGGAVGISREVPVPIPVPAAVSASPVVEMPRELVVVDSDGALVGRMRVEATKAAYRWERGKQ